MVLSTAPGPRSPTPPAPAPLPSGPRPFASGPAPLPGGPAPLPSGPVLFARYAFGPNRLGLCGPEDWRALLELGSAAGTWEGRAGIEGGAGLNGARSRAAELDRGLRELAGGFEGAFPYLQLIAEANGVADPLDARVVDAYWIGNDLSDRVDPGLMGRSIEARFRARVQARAWRWLAGKPAVGARPTHAFHVLDVFPRVGLMGGGTVADELGLMDACRIRWGTVLGVEGDRVVVHSVPLELRGGRLALGQRRVESVRRWLDGVGFLADVAIGDHVSLHWDWACEVLSPERLGALVARTRMQLVIANQTI